MVFDILLLYGTELFRTDAKDDSNNNDVGEEVDDVGGDLMAHLSFSDEAADKRQDGDQATHKLLRILVDFLDHQVLYSVMQLCVTTSFHLEYGIEGDGW